MLTKDKLFIGGQWVAPSSRETIDVHNAGNGEVMGRVPAAGERDADAAVRAARAALEGWANTPAWPTCGTASGSRTVRWSSPGGWAARAVRARSCRAEAPPHAT